MTAQRGFTLDIGTRLQIGGHFLEHLYVGLDAFGLDRTAGWREVPGGGQPQCALVRTQRDDGLHRAFAERTRADERRALWSCSAPATISEAEAEPPLINTISGLPLVRSPAWALKRWVSSALRPRVETISPLSRNASETEIA